MNDRTKQIVDSYKQAADRAAEYLQKSRNLKLKATERLELIAALTGVENWQTLHGMAKGGRAPAIVKLEATPASSPDTVEMLRDYFGSSASWGEHPDYPRDEWKYEVENDDTVAGYWSWVDSQIEQDCAMYPWERDASESVQVCRSAGLNARYQYEAMDENFDDWVVFRGGNPVTEAFNDEQRAWDSAADGIATVVQEKLNKTKDEWLKFSSTEKIALVKHVLA